MASKWDALTDYLSAVSGDRVTLTWDQLEAIVGPMPASSINHTEWWGGDRPHTLAWRAAGFTLESRAPGRYVRFVRDGVFGPPSPKRRMPEVVTSPAPAPRPVDTSERVVLVSCSKTKHRQPSPAKDLYSSARFRKARQYAESSGDPWFILSAEHGLVAPDEWLAPYDRYLPDTPSEYRCAWGEWVAARLSLLLGGVAGTTFEVHAGASYVDPIRAPLERAGALLSLPFEGMTLGPQLAWYGTEATDTSRVRTYDGDIEPYVALLSDPRDSVPAGEVSSLPRDRLGGPGLYAWFVDAEGAADLTRGLGQQVDEGLVYVGQTGATKWPTGIRSASTLRSRLLSQHLGGRRSSSTLRRTFGAILDDAGGAVVSRPELSAWMASHLRVVPVVVADGDVIGDLERQVVQRLDPPLNLDHVTLTPLRARLKALRSVSAGRE